MISNNIEENNVMVDYDHVILSDLFVEQVRKTPDAMAVTDGRASLTYAELDVVTNQLANRLIQDFQIQPDSVVGILLPRSIEYVIAYVAILKAGGAYMPLELVYPKALLERAIAQTQATVVLTNATYAPRVQDGTATPLLLNSQAPYYEDRAATITTYPPPSYQRPNADHLAFVVMSSGTTGSPKGICQTHRAAVHSYQDRFHRFPYQAGDRVGAGIFFVWELFRPLCQGATCVCIPDNVLFDPDSLTQFVATQGITRILVTPSFMQLVLDALDADTIAERLQHLRYLWFCGEVVSTDLATATTDVLSTTTQVMNLYSISECHDVSIGDLKRELDLSRKYATCGKHIPGVFFYIVDLEESEATGKLQLVPPGESGEVYVGGPVVGRGYLHMPEKTAERFVPNPFGAEDGAAPRLYRTGDLGRILPNGHLEILGRCDFMVKIRGYSVVLGAIETALAKHSQLSSAVVLAVGKEGSKDKKLVAYVVPTDWKDPPSAASVRHFLKDHVPPYAIPSTFLVMNALPVGAGAAGKLDRKALPNPDTAPRLRAFSEDVVVATTTPMEDGSTSTSIPKKQQQQQRLAPQNEFEQGILEIWAQLLDLPTQDLSALDSFFEVGGHSLLATKLVSLINTKFGLDSENGLSILHVVDSPTIRDMADKVQKASQGLSLLNLTTTSTTKIDLQAEADSLDPSIYPFPTRKGNTMSRFRLQSALMSPRVVFLTGATGWLGAHILAELLKSHVTVIALARAPNDTAAKERLVQTLENYQLLMSSNSSGGEDGGADLTEKLVGVAGDFAKPLLGLDSLQFKSLALEIDSIIHCGAQVNLLKPYAALKEANVLGTQEILRLATTNGFVQTKVKPVHYISTNGIFPVAPTAYSSQTPISVPEDAPLEAYAPHLSEGYAMTKWVAEKMCTIAEARGLPVSVMRPGNMAGSSSTGVQNTNDLNYLLMQAMLATGCAPLVDTSYALDLTPVDFAAQAAVYLAVQAPHKAMGQRFHLQTPHEPIPLSRLVELLGKLGHKLASVSRDTFLEECGKRGGDDIVLAQFASGWHTFEPYFEASTWLQYSSKNLQFALDDSSVQCPPLDEILLAKWLSGSLLLERK